MNIPRIGITIGDPAGIGPEVVAKALSRLEVQKICIPVIIGEKKYLHKKINAFIIDVPIPSKKKIVSGKYSSLSGISSYKYLVRAVELIKSRQINAVVTAPISKDAFSMAGIQYRGHTELLADFTNTKKYAMLMTAGKFRSVMITRHISVNDIGKNISSSKITDTTLLVNNFLKEKLKIKNVRIGICALNPHSGENGLLGKDEKKFIIPAIKILKNKKIDVTGPLPSDSAWLSMKNGQMDLLVTMYHDQTMIALKCLNDKRIVNTTVGLPFIRTSPGHGTAFDIAGKGIADESSMVEAIKFAVKLTVR
ncbi:4-hydroxythreonine-4-phosphate dehydrogenase PdxA [Elusimicrobiota bacterium]